MFGHAHALDDHAVSRWDDMHHLTDLATVLAREYLHPITFVNTH
jgi:hypothetical protein